MVTITNRLGLHARPGGIFSKECKKQECNVEIVKGDKRVDAKSILSLLTLQAKCGSEIELICDGAGEEASSAHLVEFLKTLPD